MAGIISIELAAAIVFRTGFSAVRDLRDPQAGNDFGFNVLRRPIEAATLNRP